MSDNAQQSATPIIDIEKESRVYKQIPGGIRLTSLGAGIGASIAFGIGTDSFAIGIGSLLALFYLGSELSLQLTKHRGCQKSE